MAFKGCELDRCKAVDLGFIHDSLKLHKAQKCEKSVRRGGNISVDFFYNTLHSSWTNLNSMFF